MCTIITVDNTFDKQLIVNQIYEDAQFNSDGFSLIMVTESGKPMVLRSMDVDTLTDAVYYLSWKRIFVHTRYATQGEANIQNTHGWDTEGTFVLHNGYISHEDADGFNVDSQAIVHWLRKHGRAKAVKKVLKESYANVLIVDTEENDWLVVRSKTGSLFTDGLGNYSTNKFGTIVQPVKQGFSQEYELGLVLPDFNRWDTWKGSKYSAYDSVNTTGSKLKEMFPDYDSMSDEEAERVDEYIHRQTKLMAGG